MTRGLLLFAGLSILAAGAPLKQYNQGVARFEQGNVEAAMTDLESAAVSSEGPLQSAALFNLALAHATLGDARRDAEPEKPESRDERVKRLTFAAESYRRALALFRRVPTPADDAEVGARATKVRLLAVLDEIQQLAEEARQEAEEQALKNPPLLLLTTLTEERDRRRAADALGSLEPRRRRLPARRLRQAEFMARSLMEKLAMALREPPEQAAAQPGAIPKELAGPAADAVQRGAEAMAEAEGRLHGGDGVEATAAQSRAIAELGVAARMLPLLLPQTVAKLLNDQQSLLSRSGAAPSARHATEESEIRSWLAHLTGLSAPPSDAEGGALSAETIEQIRALMTEAEAAAGRAEVHLRADRRSESAPEQETVIEKLEAVRKLLPQPPPSPAERIRKLIAEESAVKQDGDGLAGLADDAQKEEAARLGERQTGNGREAGSIAEQLEASPGEREKSAAGPVREAETEIHASSESYRRELPEPAGESVDRAIASLEEALRILEGRQDQDQQDGQQQQQPQQQPDAEPSPQESQQDARKLDSREARRLMEEMDRERREQEQKLFRGLGGPRVEKDW